MADYALEGQKWGSPTFGTGGGTVTWAIDATIPTYFVAQLSAAFLSWSRIGNITFSQVGSTANSLIDFSNSYIDGFNNVLGYASFSYTGSRILAADVTFDNSEGWYESGGRVLSSSGADLFVVALHEIGHAIGLDHYNASSAVMNSYLDPSVRSLTTSDIHGIQAIYGAAAANTPPVTFIVNAATQTNLWSKPMAWLSYSDSESDAAVRYEFWDSGTAATSGYFWTPSNDHWAANTTISVAATDLETVWFRAGKTAGSETVWVRAFDGKDWGAWAQATFTTQANTPPIAEINDHALAVNQWARVSGWLAYWDGNGNAATSYEFWDDGVSNSSGYFWTPDNPHQPAGRAVTVSPSGLNDLWIRAGQMTGPEKFWVRAFDGSDWSTWDSFVINATPNTPPVVTASNHQLHRNEWSRVESWVTYSDADTQAATQYEFWDDGTAASSSYFWTPGTAHHPAGAAITISASELHDVWIQGGQSLVSEKMWVRATDGTDWSVWHSFMVDTII